MLARLDLHPEISAMNSHVEDETPRERLGGRGGRDERKRDESHAWIVAAGRRR
jgi:hypothetical protein